MRGCTSHGVDVVLVDSPTALLLLRFSKKMTPAMDIGVMLNVARRAIGLVVRNEQTARANVQISLVTLSAGLAWRLAIKVGPKTAVAARALQDAIFDFPDAGRSFHPVEMDCMKLVTSRLLL